MRTVLSIVLAVCILMVGASHQARADFDDTAHDLKLSKAAMTAAKNCKLYHELVKNGMDPDEAWKRVFLGIYTVDIPGLRPIPKPDTTYLSLPDLYDALENASMEADNLKRYIEEMRLYIKNMMEKDKIVQIPH